MACASKKINRLSGKNQLYWMRGSGFHRVRQTYGWISFYDWVRSALRTVKVGVSIDPITGSPGVSVSFDTDYDGAMLSNALGLLGSFSEKRQLMVVRETSRSWKETFIDQIQPTP
jgi:hypothetical protein